ncbi:MAG: alanine racemase [Solirubrobacteraceae bacterium]
MHGVQHVRTDGRAGQARQAPHGDASTWLDREAVEALYETPAQPGTKGLPLTAAGLTLGDVAHSGWNVLTDGLPMPVMLLKQTALQTNLAVMVAYCEQYGVALCPHGKTTMSPQLFRRQIEAGAWGLTAATPAHLRLYRRFGVQRIIYANQLVEPAVIDWLATELERSPEFDFYCLVDSVRGAELLEAGLSGRTARVGVLVEVGYAGGRGGVRSRDAARQVAAAVDAAPSLELVGIECFEGLLGGTDPAALARVDEFLGFVRDVAADLQAGSSLSRAPEMIVSAGGSAYFDRVISAFGGGQTPARLILRSGCYLTQDGGFYADASPLDRRRDGPPLLRDAIEIWSAVLSRPEPGLAITSLGRRDAPQDKGMPIPTAAVVDGGPPSRLEGASVTALSDQHAHVLVDPGCALGPGDLVGFAISHPCTAFDRWRLIPVVDDAYVVCDAILTFF